MPETSRRTLDSVGDDLFDKYLLPKVALVIILLASLVGTAVTFRLAGRWAPVEVIAKWLYFVGLGVLTGGLLWKHGFVRPADLESGANEYCERMYARFDRITLLALLAIVPGTYVVLTQYAATLDDSLFVATLAVTVGGLVLLTAVDALRHGSVDESFRSPIGVLVFGLAIGAVTLTAVAEVGLRAAGTMAMVIRILHLLAFTVWIGGAVWNIFVAVPTGKERPTTAVISAAGEQLERFRWTVRFIIPTLLATGLVQSIYLFGTSVTPYVTSTIGLAILAKLGFVALLFVIFKTCPMWRACSPIDGVCDLEDLDRGSSDGSPESPDEPPAEGVADD